MIPTVTFTELVKYGFALFAIGLLAGTFLGVWLQVKLSRKPR